MSKLDKTIDEYETSILLALNAKNRGKTKVQLLRGAAKLGGDTERWGQEVYCPKKPEYPRDMYVFDPADPARIYAGHSELLAVNPVKAIGSRLELGLLDGATFKWFLIQPVPRPRGIVAISNRPVRWYAMHERGITEGKRDTYVRQPMALTEDGEVQLLKPLGCYGWEGKREREETAEQLAMFISVFEDAIRSNAMLATVEEHIKLRFPIGAESYKSFFRLRDGLRDTPTGRRNPILHWCAEHFRTRNDNTFLVEGHDRGTHTVKHGAMTLTIQNNEGYGRYL